MAGEQYPLTIDGTTLTVQVTRKRVRHVNARLHGDQLRVSAPPGVPADELCGVIEQLARRLVRRRHANELNRENVALRIARAVAARFPGSPTVREVLFVTNQRARWGSYSARTGTIRLHAALREMPPWVLEAVVAHELAHVSHLDHSPAFWELLHRVCPATERARGFLAGVAWLARHGDALPPIERSLLDEC